ncbi:DUF2634 domain-containing protein [Ruminiclostridium papyrosolvens]|uniref:Phage protein n=1 Tax=Ruminiclostridium papyrosolvens C7 TaxID=1330534 RepID=U4R2E5_9FIRM|nr:DUF2634 domain-containing protein [Ruminiclostridium papyrosolvens]EPR12309.1 hypothetical protein L323_08500 [Ruminiclostridium papyrosolvens C7]
MIPTLNDDLQPDFEVCQQPGRTYKMNLEEMRIGGSVDGIEAIKQAIYKILNTQKFQYLIYSWDYGIELTDLFGESTALVYSEIENRIREALQEDDRITDVRDFSFESGKRQVLVRFTAYTTEGTADIEKVVMV